MTLPSMLALLALILSPRRAWSRWLCRHGWHVWEFDARRAEYRCRDCGQMWREP